jgi:hypothetical protein
MNNEEVTPGNLGGLGGMLPAEVLKMLNELLEQIHRVGHSNQGSTVINIYEKGSMHIDRVDNQIIYGDKWAKTIQGKEYTENQPLFDNDTPLSALFRENHHKELRKIIESWRPYLINDDTNIDALAMTHFEFDFSNILAKAIYIDMGRLLCQHPLEDDNIHTLANYLFLHSNLSNSQPTLYAQLRKYLKR